ncbi:MAG: 50S ribosomal protein L9 [Chloroflexota bacterium]|nr:50S ribosomal protein L9 [Chloroflexota bacterium]
MKILLLKDVYKLGRAGDVKKVANGYGRNYLIPQGLAVLATPGAIKQADYIRVKADKERAIINEEMGEVIEQMKGIVITFPVRASETGRLYGSVNTRMIAESLSEEMDMEITHRQIDSQPIRMIGKHKIGIRLTVDLVPEIDVVIYREGETPAESIEEAEELAEEAEQAESESAGWADYDYDVPDVELGADDDDGDNDEVAAED